MSSSNKRYYWLKLKEDFFEDDTIQWLEEQDNGKDYVIFYLKLALKSLDGDGKLIRYVGERLLPYDVKALAKLTNTSPDTVAVAMKTFIDIGLVSRLEGGEIYMNQIQEMVGSETRAAESMRRLRATEKAQKQLENNSGNNVTESYPELLEIEIDKELEIELKIEKEIDKKQKKKKFGEFSNVLLTEQEFEKLKEKFPHDYLQRIERVSGYVASTGKSYKSHYATIISWARKDEQNAPQKKVVNSDWEKQMQELME